MPFYGNGYWAFASPGMKEESTSGVDLQGMSAEEALSAFIPKRCR